MVAMASAFTTWAQDLGPVDEGAAFPLPPEEEEVEKDEREDAELVLWPSDDPDAAAAEAVGGAALNELVEGVLVPAALVLADS